MLAYRAETPFPGLMALPPVLGTALVLLFAGPATLVGRGLGLRPMLAVGLISYSLYLWHNPVLVFARHALVGPVPPLLATACIGLTFVLVWASWRYVEPPFRHSGTGARVWLPGPARMLGAPAAAIVVFVGLGVLGDRMKGFPDCFDPAHLALLEASEWNQVCLYQADKLPPDSEPMGCRPGMPSTDAAPKQAVLIGDSMASLGRAAVDRSA